MSDDPHRNGELALDQNGDLPDSYGETRLVAMALDPERLLVYWDLAHDPGGPLALRVRCQSDGTTEEIELKPDATRWYVPVRPNRSYVVEIGVGRGNAFRPLAASGGTGTPVRDPDEVVKEADLAAESPVVAVRPRPEPAAAGEWDPAAEPAEEAADRSGSPLWRPAAELTRLFRRAAASSSRRPAPDEEK